MHPGTVISCVLPGKCGNSQAVTEVLDRSLPGHRGAAPCGNRPAGKRLTNDLVDVKLSVGEVIGGASMPSRSFGDAFFVSISKSHHDLKP